MKQISLLALGISSLFSVSSYAVQDGTSLSWEKYPYIVESQCSGTVIAGKYILLAGHCGASIDNPFPRLVNFSDGSAMMPIHKNAEPYYQEKNSSDVALWTLPESAPINTIAFIDNLNDPNTMPTLGDKVSFIGFGQKDNIPRLGKGINSIIKEYPSIFIYGDAQAYSVPGDSGAPVFNEQNKVIAVNYSGAGSIDRNQNGVNLRFVKDWLLKSIDAWHSPTELKFTGSKTIEIQSLHVNPTNLADRQNAGILTTGDINVTGGTCVTDGDVAPFGTCTLELQAGNNEGHVQLEDGNTITINRTPEPKPEPQPQPEGGKSGGSMGWLGLLGLLAFAFKRK